MPPVRRVREWEDNIKVDIGEYNVNNMQVNNLTQLESNGGRFLPQILG
jgi:hypothetical protein